MSTMAGTNGLHRRLTALEEIAEEVRARPARRLAAELARERGLTVTQEEDLFREVVADLDAWTAKIDGLHRGGLSTVQIIDQIAAELGTTSEDLDAECRRWTRA
jgi:hypothetical protein